MYPPSRNQRRL